MYIKNTYIQLRQASIQAQGMGIAHCDISAENALGQPRVILFGRDYQPQRRLKLWPFLQSQNPGEVSLQLELADFRSNMSFRLRMFGWRLELEPRSLDIWHPFISRSNSISTWDKLRFQRPGFFVSTMESWRPGFGCESLRFSRRSSGSDNLTTKSKGMVQVQDSKSGNPTHLKPDLGLGGCTTGFCHVRPWHRSACCAG